jgi:hypothetical protein
MQCATLDLQRNHLVSHAYNSSCCACQATMVALVSPGQVLGLQVVEVVVEGPPPLVRQVVFLLEAMAVQAPHSPSQARPPHTLGEVGVWGQTAATQMRLLWEALGVQGAGAKAVTLAVCSCLSLGLPTLVVGAGVGFLEHQVAPAS